MLAQSPSHPQAVVLWYETFAYSLYYGIITLVNKEKKMLHKQSHQNMELKDKSNLGNSEEWTYSNSQWLPLSKCWGRGAVIKRIHRLPELEQNCSREYQKILVPLLSSTCSHGRLTGTLHGTSYQKKKKKRPIVPIFARCKTVQVDVKWFDWNQRSWFQWKFKALCYTTGWGRRRRRMCSVLSARSSAHASFLLLWIGWDTNGIS